MSCPVQEVIAELYATGRYEDGDMTSYIGGGDFDDSKTVEAPTSDILFYITQRKIEFARAGLNSDSIISEGTMSVYHERMFRDYLGKTSKEIFWKLFRPICERFCFKFAQTVDVLVIMENICEQELSRTLPDNMSLPEISFNENALCDIESDPAKLTTEVNKLVSYANKLCVGGIKTTVEPIGAFDNTLRDFTFEGAPEELIAQDMEVAEYAFGLEKYYTLAVDKLYAVSMLCQKIIDITK
jgi:hypothetical protein